MRILYLHQYFVPPGASGGTRSYEFARRWVRAGHEVTLLTSCAAFPPALAAEVSRGRMEVEGIRIRVLGIPYSNALSNAQRIERFGRFAVAASLEAVRAARPDVIFATSTPLTIAVPGMLARARHRCPMVFEVRDLWPEIPIVLGALRGRLPQALARALERAAYRSSARVIALSPGMRDGVLRTGYPAERVTVIPNLANVALFGNGETTEDPEWRARLGPGPLVAYTGAIGFVNGLEYLVALARETRALDPRVRFVILGKGREQEVVERAARDAGVLGDTLRILPPVPKSEIPRVLATVDMASSFVRDVPALFDNSANKFFDALAAGRPVLINHGGWQADLLRRTGAGIAVPAGDPAAGARQLVDLLSDAGRLRAAGRAALQLAREEFDVERLAARALGVLQEAVARP